jgi:hypothetical protein
MGKDVIVLAGTNRRIQQQRFTKGWTQARRERFLDHVAATCNVREATEVVGLSQAGLYALRRRDPVFAEQWRMALLAGYDRLEAALVRTAIAALDGVAVGDPDKIVCQPVTVEQAIKLLDRHQAMIGRRGTIPRDHARRATQEETDAMLLERLKAFKRRLEREA